MTEMVRCEDDRSGEVWQVFESANIDPREGTSQRQYPQRQVDAANGTRRKSPVPGRKYHRLSSSPLVRLDWLRRSFGGRRNSHGRGLCCWCAGLHQRLQVADCSRVRELALVNRRVELFFQGGHQLDALQRAQAQLVDGGRAGHAIAMCQLRDDRGDGSLASGSGSFSRLAACFGPPLQLTAFELSCAFGSRKPVLCPDRRRPNLLMLFEPGIGLPHDVVLIRARFQCEDGVDALLTIACETDDCRFANAGDLVEHALDVLREDVETFGR